MILTWLMYAVAISLSAVAAFYSIVGLAAIFAAAVWPIIIMGTILEVAKLTVTVWLHEHWRQCKWVMKLYLVPAVVVLMVITSMGIFGFLSKAHIDQVIPTGDKSAQLALFDERIANERAIIENSRSLIKQMDDTVNGIIANGESREIKLQDGRTIVRSAAEQALQVRRSQAQDRDRLTKTIEESQARIVAIQEERAPIAKEIRGLEAEVGPIKYIAALIYGDNPDTNLLERAVRWMIIILVAVFDPLAIMMLLAATESHRWYRERQIPLTRSTAESDKANPDPDVAIMPQDPVFGTRRDVGPPTERLADYKILEDISESDHETVATSMVNRTSVANQDDDEEADEQDIYKEAKRTWKENNPGQTLKEQRRLLALGRIDRLPWEMLPTITGDFGFGTEFPGHAAKGDQFVRTDSLPTRLYKFNGDQWIESDKSLTDSYAHDQKYIDFLIDRISKGQYDPELLTASERSEIEARLKTDL